MYEHVDTIPKYKMLWGNMSLYPFTLCIYIYTYQLSLSMVILFMKKYGLNNL